MKAQPLHSPLHVVVAITVTSLLLAACGSSDPIPQSAGDATIDSPQNGIDSGPPVDAAPEAASGCNAPAECPNPANDCKKATCQSQVCGTADLPLGTACTSNNGKVCNGTGSCVAAHCSDGVMDADETDVDCGGSCGATCKDSGPQQKCLGAGDCISGVCDSVAKTCTPPTCNDGIKNGSETDTDCGGAQCDAQNKTCADAKTCKANVDCTNGNCAANKCISCSDASRTATRPTRIAAALNATR